MTSPADPSQAAARAGQRLRHASGAITFEPIALPPPGLDLDGAAYRALSEADRALGALHGHVSARGTARAHVAMANRREAVASCRLDGSRIRLQDLLWWELDGARADRLTVSRGEARICRNYVSLLESLEDEDDGVAETGRRQLCALHAALFRGLRGRDDKPGRLRDSLIWLGPPGSTVATASYVPPAPEGIDGHLERLQAFVDTDGPLPPLARVALLFHQLESIHPFVDGSGRVARLTLIRLLRSAQGSWPQLLLPSEAMAGDLGQHFHQLQHVRRTGDWEGWIVHFAGRLRAAAEAAMAHLEREEGLLREHEELVHRELPGLSRPATSLLHSLASQPLLTVSEAARICGRTYANANLLVRRLQALGLLRELTGRRRHRRYLYVLYRDLTT